MEGLSQLQYLNLSNNQISKLENLEGLSQLQSLELFENQISKLENLEGLSQLQNLVVMSNQISKLENLEGLSQLQYLVVSNNQISKLENLEGLSQLKVLDLNQNKLTSQNFNLSQLYSLIFLNLSNNQFLNLPSEIANLENCLIDLTHFALDLAEESELNYEAKLILVGNGRVGKTSILKRFFENTFDPGQKTTHGIQLYSKSFQIGKDENDEETQLQINAWDFGGQEIYHATHRLFMKSRALYLVVWDEETENTLKSLEIIDDKEVFFDNYLLPYWLNKSRSLSWNSPLLVVQNKVDKHEVRLPDNSNEIQQQFAVKNFISTSAVNERLFSRLRAEILFEIEDMPEMGMLMPSQWLRVKETMMELQAERTLDYDRYLEICKEIKLSEGSAITLLSWLHNTGTVFHQGELFHNKIILDQKWALEGIYLIFKRNWVYHMIKNANGVVTLKSLEGPWAQYEPADRKLFLSMMESCEICFKMEESPDDVRYLIPEYLPEEKSYAIAQHWQEEADGDLRFRYWYLFFHSAFMMRFIARAGRLTKNYNYIWKRGIWITYQNTEALIEAFPRKSCITIRIRGNAPHDLLKRINKEFQEIFYDPKGVKLSFGVQGDDWVDYNRLKVKNADEEHVPTEKGRIARRADFSQFLKSIDPDSKVGKEKDLKSIVPPAKVVKDSAGEQEELAKLGRMLNVHLKSLITLDLDSAFKELFRLHKEVPDHLHIQWGSYKDVVQNLANGEINHESFGLIIARIRKSLINEVNELAIAELNREVVLDILDIEE